MWGGGDTLGEFVSVPLFISSMKNPHLFSDFHQLLNYKERLSTPPPAAMALNRK
jgi:hypothetical protein